MKKVCLSLTAVFLAALFTGCENFLDGADHKKIIDDEISYVNSKTMSVKISAESISQGMVMCLNHNAQAVHAGDV
ncbi:MAG: hypothetical protein J6Y93_01520, partial [Treponema sp.]|nr:hypothetical protein [Treponema sp.]